VSDIVDTLRQIVRQELGGHRAPELGLVLEVFPGDGGEGNHQADIRLRESGLTLRRVPVAVARPGVSLLPRVGDPVVVVFLGGDVAQPVVVGSIYSAQEQPPEAGPLEAAYVPSDAEESGVRRVHLETPSGGTVTLDDETLTVTLGGTSMTLKQDGDVEIAAAGSITLKADGDITLEAGGKLSGTAGQDVSFEAQVGFSAKGTASASVAADGTGELKAASITIAGLTNFSAS
jgi:uncharacterized protein involved in type VI secretion and phage assembly